MLEGLTAKAKVLGKIPASSDTLEFEGRQMNKVHKKSKLSPFFDKYSPTLQLLSETEEGFREDVHSL